MPNPFPAWSAALLLYNRKSAESTVNVVRSRVEHGEAVEISCQPGHRVRGPPTFTCNQGDWALPRSVMEPEHGNDDTLLHLHNENSRGQARWGGVWKTQSWCSPTPCWNRNVDFLSQISIFGSIPCTLLFINMQYQPFFSANGRFSKVLSLCAFTSPPPPPMLNTVNLNFEPEK
jgi:hypothetical protein